MPKLSNAGMASGYRHSALPVDFVRLKFVRQQCSHSSQTHPLHSACSVENKVPAQQSHRSQGVLVTGQMPIKKLDREYLLLLNLVRFVRLESPNPLLCCHQPVWNVESENTSSHLPIRAHGI